MKKTREVQFYQYGTFKQKLIKNNLYISSNKSVILQYLLGWQILYLKMYLSQLYPSISALHGPVFLHSTQILCDFTYGKTSVSVLLKTMTQARL